MLDPEQLDQELDEVSAAASRPPTHLPSSAPSARPSRQLAAARALDQSGLTPPQGGCYGHVMTELKIQGMSCSHCSAAVERALKGVTGVTQAQVDLEAGTANVQGSAALEDLLAAVSEEGYTASPAA